MEVEEEGSEVSGDKGASGRFDNKGSLDDILSRVRKARSMRGDKTPLGSPGRRSSTFDSTGGSASFSGTMKSAEDASKTGFERTSDVLERVKSRREARAKASEGGKKGREV